MDSLFSLFKGILGSENFDRKPVGNTVVEEYTIDTCDTVDQGYETAIWKGQNPMVIVQRYPDREQAIIGHEAWVNVCKLKPTSVWSPQFDDYVSF